MLAVHVCLVTTAGNPMPSFKVPCPSCEAKVLIKNPDLVGKKVECPKCKYRFKVEAPVGEPATGDAKADDVKPADTKDKKDKKSDAAPGSDKAKGKGDKKKSKKTLGIVLGAVGVLVLVVGAVVVFGGGDDKPSSSGGGGGSRGGGTYAGNTGTENPENTEKKDDPAAKKPKATVVPRSDKDPTNLLPNQTVAVYRFNIERLRMETPIGGYMLDKPMTDLFESSMGFDPAKIERYFHCIVGEKERAPFGLIWLKEPLPASDVKIAGAGSPRPVNGKTLYTVKGNPFLTAVGGALAARSLFAEVYDRPPAVPAVKAGKPADVPFGACVYDTQTILVGDHAALEKYLKELKDGYPEFQTVWKKDEPPPSAPMPGGMPPMPAGMPPTTGAVPGTTPSPPPTTPMPGSMTPTAPAVPGAMPPMSGPMTPAPMTPAGKGPAAPPANKDYTSNPSYLSVPGELKKMLNALDEDPTGPPIVAMAEKFDNAAYERKGVKKAYEAVVKVIDPVLSRAQYVGLTLTTFEPGKVAGSIRVVGKTTDDARYIAQQQLGPALTDAVPLLSLVLFSNPYVIEFRNATDPNKPPPGMGYPGSPFPTPGAGPESLGPVPGMTSPPLPPMPGPMTMGVGAPPPRPGVPLPPGVPPMPGFPGPGAVGPGMEEPGFGMQPPPPTPSHIDLTMTDQVVTFTVDLRLTDEGYMRIVPRLFGTLSQLKGKASVYAGSRSWYGLAEAVKKYTDQNKRFPAGTVSRPSEPSRLSLPYPPIQRLSFFAELLPYLGRDSIAALLNRGRSWADPENAAATDSWVPEFLVPYYPQTAWRATTPLVPERVFGGTNFVAIAGVGPDAARLDPTNPAHTKLIGVSGYDWGSKVEDVTDGLANTIYLMQVPPGYARPWAAGGGATLTGINPTDPMTDFKHQRPDGKSGTYAIMADGTVRWIPADIKPADLIALVTRAGGEKLSGDLDTIAPKVTPSGKDAELNAAPKPVETARVPAEKKSVDPNEAKPADVKAGDGKTTSTPPAKSDAPTKEAPKPEAPAPKQK